MIESFAFDMDDLADAREPGGGLGCCAGIVACDQHVDIAAESLGGGDGLGGDVVEGGVAVFSEDENGHDQMAPTDLSFAIRASTSATFSPASRFFGSATFTIDRRGAMSTP